MKQVITISMIALCMSLLSGVAQAKTIRATDMTSSLWSDLSRGALGDLVVEFRQGDELPVTFSAEGDLLETTHSASSYVGVKRNFWVRLQQTKIQMSLDNVAFKDVSDILSGSFQAGAGSDQNGGAASAISLALKAYLK